MTPARMRLRLWSLLGLPACTPHSAAQAPADTVVDIPRVVSSVVTVEHEEEPPPEPKGPVRSCGKDRFRGWTCGPTMSGSELGPSGCPVGAGGIYAMITFPLHVSVDRSSTYDEPLTQLYRQRTTSGPEQCCYSQCMRADVRTGPDPVPDGWSTRIQCIPELTTTSLPAPDAARCPKALVMPGGPNGAYAAGLDAQATKEQESYAVYQSLGTRLCCYATVDYPMAVPGRALRVDGEPRTSGVRASGDWSADVGAAVLGPDRDELAARWLRDAALEHASVAAFARLSLELMALSAPPDLLAGAHEAALDEIEHARLAYALASHYRGKEIGPGPLALDRVDRPVSAEALARETFRDGCVGELYAAALAGAEAEATVDPALARIHRRIADDEMRHAELAWRILAWLLQGDPTLAPCIDDELRKTPARTPLERKLLDEVIAPCAAELTARA